MSNTIETEKLDEWCFPELNKLNFHEKNDDLSLQLLENKKVNQELQNLKEEYEKKIESINRIIEKLQDPSLIFDNDLIELLEDIIKSSVKKIIFRELQSDPGLIRNIITELTSLVSDEKSVVTVYVSEQDNQRLFAEKNKSRKTKTAPVVMVSSDLNEGDVIVKSNFKEIRAILNDRINQILEK